MTSNKTSPTIPYVFKNGLALSVGVALTIDAYIFTKNLTMDSLLFYALPLITLVLAGIAITYFAYRRLSTFNLPTFFVGALYGAITIECGLLLLRGFIHSQVPYGYLLLPIATIITGAFVLTGIVGILRLKSNDFIKGALFLFALTFATAMVVFTK